MKSLRQQMKSKKSWSWLHFSTLFTTKYLFCG